MSDLYAPLLDSPHERQGIGDMSEPNLSTIEPNPDAHESVLTEAQGLVHGDRNAAYGHPLDDFSRTAKMWEVVLDCKVTPEQFALCMICVKISRLCNTPGHEDSVVDIAGYAGTYEMVRAERHLRQVQQETFGPLPE